MSHRVVAGVLFLVSSLLIPLGYLLIHPEIAGWCQTGTGFYCDQNIGFGIGKPLYWSIRWLPVLFFALIFVSAEVFRKWWKITIVFWAIALLLILMSSPISQNILDVDRTQVTETATDFMVILSFVVIALSYAWIYSKRLFKKYPRSSK